MTIEEIKKLILDVPNFPKEGILFKDITPVLDNCEAFSSLIRHMAETIDQETTHLAAIESRGFILGSALALYLKKPLVLVRKPGKLPRETVSFQYDLEYGTDRLEIHKDSFTPNAKVMIIDDVLATGGTAHAAEQLCEKMGTEILGFRFFIELGVLKGKGLLKAPSQSFVVY